MTQCPRLHTVRTENMMTHVLAAEGGYQDVPPWAEVSG